MKKFIEKKEQKLKCLQISLNQKNLLVKKFIKNTDFSI